MAQVLKVEYPEDATVSVFRQDDLWVAQRHGTTHPEKSPNPRPEVSFTVQVEVIDTDKQTALRKLATITREPIYVTA